MVVAKSIESALEIYYREISRRAQELLDSQNPQESIQVYGDYLALMDTAKNRKLPLYDKVVKDFKELQLRLQERSIEAEFQLRSQFYQQRIYNFLLDKMPMGDSPTFDQTVGAIQLSSKHKPQLSYEGKKPVKTSQTANTKLPLQVNDYDYIY